MRRLPSLWHSLEHFPGLQAVPAFWELKAGEDFEFIKPHLRPTDTVGPLYPCPRQHGHCPRKIVDYGDGEFAAICRDPERVCPRVPLKAHEALLHELDLASFLPPILRALAVRQGQWKKRGYGTWGVGLSAHRSSMNQPVFLIIVNDEAAFESAVNVLLLDVSGQFLILAPTNQHRSVQVQERLQARNIGYVDLDEQIGVDESGRFVSVDPADSSDCIQATPVEARKRVVAAFRAEHRCKVVDIQEAAGIHESDYYKWLNGTSPDHYSTCLAIEKVLALGLCKKM